jgi:hypothetical protein
MLYSTGAGTGTGASTVQGDGGTGMDRILHVCRGCRYVLGMYEELHRVVQCYKLLVFMTNRSYISSFYCLKNLTPSLRFLFFFSFSRNVGNVFSSYDNDQTEFGNSNSRNSRRSHSSKDHDDDFDIFNESKSDKERKEEKDETHVQQRRMYGSSSSLNKNKISQGTARGKKSGTYWGRDACTSCSVRVPSATEGDSVDDK